MNRCWNHDAFLRYLEVEQNIRLQTLNAIVLKLIRVKFFKCEKVAKLIERFSHQIWADIILVPSYICLDCLRKNFSIIGDSFIFLGRNKMASKSIEPWLGEYLLFACIPLNGHIEFHIITLAGLMKSSTTHVGRIWLFASPLKTVQLISLDVAWWTSLGYSASVATNIEI